MLTTCLVWWVLSVFIHNRETMLKLQHATMRFSEQILWQLMALSIGEIHSRRQVELVKQSKIIFELFPSGQQWQKLMQIWLQLIKTGNDCHLIIHPNWSSDNSPAPDNTSLMHCVFLGPDYLQWTCGSSYIELSAGITSSS